VVSLMPNHGQSSTNKQMTTDTNTEKPDYEIAREELNEYFLKTLRIGASISSPYGHVKDEWPSIGFQVSFTAPRGTYTKETFEYSLGIGHVDWKKAARSPKYSTSFGYSEDNRLVDFMARGVALKKTPELLGHQAALAAEIARLQKVRPNPAEVLASVCREALDAEETFSDWCANFGYEEDSRKAESIYRACQDNGAMARKLVTRGTNGKAR
jgi:hypothetical protein